jgi:hypothetical protein
MEIIDKRGEGQPLLMGEEGERLLWSH